MKTFYFRFLVIVILCSSILQAQQTQNLDSLIRQYTSQDQDTLKVNTSYALYDYYRGHQPKRALQYAMEGLALSNELDYKYGMAKGYTYKAAQWQRVRALDSSNFYLQKALNLYKELGNVHEQGMTTVSLAYLIYLRGNYKNALVRIDSALKVYSRPVEDSVVVMHLLNRKANTLMRITEYEAGFKAGFRALAYSEQLKLPVERAKILRSIAALYHYTDNKEKAISMTKQALEIQTALNNRSEVALLLNDIGNSHYVIEQYDMALKYLEESLPISRELELNSLIGITTFNVGKTYVRKGQVAKGIAYLKESIHYSQNISHNPLSESWALKRLADVYTEELERPEMAIPLLNRAVILADSIGNKDDLYQSYRDRSQAFALLGNFKKALEDHEIYKAINDSVYNLEKSKEIERLKTEFETKEKEQQIVLQEKEIDILEKQAAISNLQIILLGLGLLLALVALYALRQKMKQNRLEKQKIDAELAFKKKELTTHALHLAKKNEVLEGLKLKARELKSTEVGSKGYTQLIRTIDFDLQDDNNWENFARYFEAVHKDFNSNVKTKYPQITPNELRLLALLKMNLTSKEVASILNISPEGIKKARYRLRKKLDISTEESLQDLVMTL